MNAVPKPPSKQTSNSIVGGGMSKDLEGNCFQWRNLYIHRFGVCTYAPPMPKDPETTTQTYPTTSQLVKLRAMYGVTSATAEPMSPATPAAGATSSAASSVIEKTLVKAAIGGSKAPTYYQQRRAEAERSKKLQREEIARQNPHGLASSVLRLHQAAWRLIMDDSVALQSAKLSQEHSQLAHVLESHFKRHGSTVDGAYFRRGRALSLASKRTSIFSMPAVSSQPGFARLLGGEHSPDDDGAFSRGDSFGDPFAQAYSKAQVEAICCGADHLLHAALRDEEATAATLYEFSPFFVSVSPPDAVAAMEATWRARKFQTLPEGRGAGAGELLGLPMFSQFQSWQEAYQRRTEWQYAPFHFFLTHDHSYNFAHIAAILTLLELHARYKHQHIADATAAAAAEKTAQRTATTVKLKKKQSIAPVGTTAVTPQQQALPPGNPRQSPTSTFLPGVQTATSGTFGLESSLSMSAREDTRRGPSSPRAQRSISIVASPPDIGMIPVVSMPGFGSGNPGSGDFSQKSRDRRAPPDDMSGRLKLLMSLDRTVDTAPRVICSRHCCSKLDEGIKNPCPVLAFEIAVEDLLVIYEQSSNRAAFKLIFQLFHYFLDKAMKPGHAATALLTQKHIFPVDDPVGKINRVVTDLEDSTRMREKKRRMSRVRKISLLGINIESDGESETSSDDDAKNVSAGSGGSAYSEDEDDADDEDPVSAKLSAFSELEFNAVFHLAAYYVDMGFNMSSIKRYAKPGALAPQTNGATGSPTRQSNEAEQLYRAAMSVNFAPTATIAEAVLRFEAQQQVDATRKKILRQASIQREKCTLNIQRKIQDHEDRLAEAAQEMERYRHASNLATPLILLGSYMRVHGAGWVRQVTRNVIEYLSSPFVQIYVTAEMLEDPVQALELNGKVKVQAVPGDSMMSRSTVGLKKKKSTFGGVASMLLHAQSSPVMKSLIVENNPPPFIGLEATKSPNTEHGGSLFTLGVEAGGIRKPSQLSVDSITSPRWSVSCPPETEQQPPSSNVNDEDRYTGYTDSEKLMFLTLERNEERMCKQIEDAIRILFVDLEKSHFYERMPAGISRLLTELCTTVHAQVLSGIVVLPPGSGSGGPGELSGNQLVELYISTLLGDRRKPQQQAPQKAPVRKRGVTMIVDGEEGEDAPQQQPPGTAGTTPRRTQDQTESTPTGASTGTPKKETCPPPDVSTNITLISDIRKFRLAKFILFDTWILPILTNALRYGLVNQEANMHTLRNIDAFARYVKIVINGPFRAREAERKNTAAAIHREDSGPGSGLGGLAKKPVTSVYGMSAPGGGTGAGVPSKNTIVLQPHISGVYNASTGGLVQLFVPPEDRREAQADGSESEDTSSVADSDGGTVGSHGGRRRSSGGGRKKLRRTSSAGSSDDDGGMTGGGKGGLRKQKSLKGHNSTLRRKSSVVAPHADKKPNSTKELPMPRRRAEIVFRPQSDKWWPALRDLSPAMQRLNATCGVSDSRSEPSSGVPPVSSGQTPFPTLVNYFCWRASTNEDVTGMMPEYNVPPSAAAQAIENLHSIVVGTHPAVRPKLSRIVEDFRNPAEPILTGEQSFSKGGAGAGSDVSSSDEDSTQGMPLEENVVDEEGRSQFIRVLHSVLHYPTFASTFLENINVNNKKLFQYLVRPSASLGNTLNSVMSHHSQSAITPRDVQQGAPVVAAKRGSTSFPWLTSGDVGASLVIPSAKLTDFSHLWTALASLIVQRDVPLLDVNAVLSVVAMASEQPPRHNLLPPPSLVASHIRLLQKQQFVTTALALPISSTSQPSATAGTPSTFSTISSSLFPDENPQKGVSHGAGSGKRVLQKSAGPSTTLNDNVSGADCPFHSFYSGLAIALCAKAAAVLEECSQTQNDAWVRKCGRHLTRSTNEQLALQQLTGPLATDAIPAKLLTAHGKPQRKRRKVPVSPTAPRPPKGAMQGTGRRRGGEESAAVDNPTPAVSAGPKHAVADRWRRAVTDMVMVQALVPPAGSGTSSVAS